MKNQKRVDERVRRATCNNIRVAKRECTGRCSVHEGDQIVGRRYQTAKASRTVQRAGMLIYGALGSCIVTGLPGASGAGAHSVLDPAHADSGENRYEVR